MGGVRSVKSWSFRAVDVADAKGFAHGVRITLQIISAARI